MGKKEQNSRIGYDIEVGDKEIRKKFKKMMKIKEKKCKNQGKRDLKK